MAEIIGDGNVSDFDESDLEIRVRNDTEAGYCSSSDENDVSDPEPDFTAPLSFRRSRSPTRSRSRSVENVTITRTSPFSQEPVPNLPTSISPHRGRVCDNRYLSTRRPPRSRGRARA